jgi:hypothetical protein
MFAPAIFQAGDLPIQKQSKMTEQEEKQMSIEYLVKKINELEQDLIELEKQHEQSLKVAFKKGYEKGYTDHANLINMLNK